MITETETDEVPWAEPAHNPCPECGVCQDAHGETRRIFHTTTCSRRDEPRAAQD